MVLPGSKGIRQTSLHFSTVLILSAKFASLRQYFLGTVALSRSTYIFIGGSSSPGAA